MGEQSSLGARMKLTFRVVLAVPPVAIGLLWIVMGLGALLELASGPDYDDILTMVLGNAILRSLGHNALLVGLPYLITGLCLLIGRGRRLAILSAAIVIGVRCWLGVIQDARSLEDVLRSLQELFTAQPLLDIFVEAMFILYPLLVIGWCLSQSGRQAFQRNA